MEWDEMEQIDDTNEMKWNGAKWYKWMNGQRDKNSMFIVQRKRKE